jgi:tetratricopeptide (TPR) repeat protein
MKLKDSPFLPMAVILLFSISCSSDGMLTQKRVTREMPLLIKVFNGESRACSGVSVELRSDDGNIQVGYTDITGKIFLSAMAQGHYSVVLSKENYEPVTMEFDFHDSDQAVYGKLFSDRELLKLCSQSMERQEWDRALELLDRVDRIENARLWEALFLRSVVYWKRGDYPLSLALLEEAYEPQMPYELILFYADLLQYDRGDKEKALDLLRDLQRRKKDDSLDSRIELLENEISGENNE